MVDQQLDIIGFRNGLIEYILRQVEARINCLVVWLYSFT